MLFNCTKNCNTCNNRVCQNGHHDNDIVANRVTASYHSTNRVELKSRPAYRVYTAYNGTKTGVMRFDSKKK